ncbi:MAG TPA: tetratricopeptide repeat protein, partial [Armatimonadota bacterium]
MICGRCGHKIEDTAALCMRCRIAFTESISSVHKIKLPPRRSLLKRRIAIIGTIVGLASVALAKYVTKSDWPAVAFSGAVGFAAGAAIAVLPKLTLGAYYRWRLNRARRAFENRLDRVTRRYEKRIEENPEDRKAMHELALACMASHNYERAVSLFEQAAEREEDPGRLYNHLAVALISQRKADRAFKAWQDSLEALPDYAPAHFNSAIAHITTKEYDRATAEFDQAILGDENGTRERLPVQMGTLKYEHGDIGGAIKEFTRALDADPHSGDIRNNLGVCYYRYGENNRGVNELYAAQRDEPGHARSYANLGLIQLLENNLADAVLTLSHA